jgi:hypothetical protein
MPYNFGPYLDQLIAQGGQRLLADPGGQGQRAQEIANIVCQGEQLQPHLVVPEVMTRQPLRKRPLSIQTTYSKARQNLAKLLDEITNGLQEP